MFIYSVKNQVNGKIYIGKTTKSVEERIKEHLQESYNQNQKIFRTVFHKAIRKYGIHQFEVSTIATANTEMELNSLEENFIRQLNTHYRFGNGYNMTYGGEGTKGVFRSTQTRTNMSNAQKGKKKSPKTLKKLKNSMIEWGKGIAKQWQITDPNGNVFIITNLRRYCIDNNLDQGNMMKVAKGKIHHNKGYKVKPFLLF